MLSHWIHGLRDRVTIEHGGRRAVVTIERDRVASLEPARVEVELGPGLRAAEPDRGGWRTIRDGADSMRFRVWYHPRSADPGRLEVLFDAARDWRITWEVHDPGRVPNPRRAPPC